MAELSEPGLLTAGQFVRINRMDALTFAPYFRPQIWGDRRLASRLGKLLPAAGCFGEAWEISSHPMHESRMEAGPLAGETLASLWSKRGEEFFGTIASRFSRFPLLVKYLDCDQRLSVQVHPDDALAARLLPGEWGKTEAWLVLESEPEGRIFAGLKPGTTREELTSRTSDGTVAECLHSFHPEPGDCLLIPAGTVHAVGNGVLMAEIQQTSDATFRLFDWNRPGPDGHPRALHVPQSLECIDWSRGPVNPLKPQRIEATDSGTISELLCECPYFRLIRHQVSQSLRVPVCDRCTIWMVLSGSAQLQAETEHSLSLGQTILLPRHESTWNWQTDSRCTLLEVRIP